jgi:transposase
MRKEYIPMIYVGIDIGKRNHEATILDESGKEVTDSVKFPNTRAGVQKLLGKVPDPSDAVFGLEATGHYWVALYSSLVSDGLEVIVLNPIQSDSLRNLYIRRTKTDKRDSFIIADVLRMGRYPQSRLADEETMELQSLCRLRFEFLDQVIGLKQRLICILDKIFPEYESMFSSVFIKSSRTLLKNAPTPEDILEFDLSELSELLSSQSRGRFGESKAKELKSAAKNSFGIGIALNAFRLQLRMLLDQMEFIEAQIQQIDGQVRELMKNRCTCITSIPGIGEVLAASIVAEIGDISRFSSPKKLTAYAGLDSTVHQSGQFTGTRSRISKRGSTYLRRAIWSAAALAKKYNPVISEYYQKKIQEGKHPQLALGACARKLTHLIYYILKEQKPFDPDYQWSGIS